MRGLNHILANKSQLIVLRVLFHAQTPMTGRSVEHATGLSNRAVMNALSFLIDAKAVNMTLEGNAHLHVLNKNHYIVQKALKPAFEAEELFWDDLHKTILKIVRPKPIAAVATGPLAREETEYGGRLMLTMLFASGRKRIKSLATLQQLSESIRDRYGMILEHNLLDINTMNQEEYIPLWRRVEREGILLFGELP